ncbi:MAG: hypothetical protein J2P58_01455 [Acidimicrobiaceae bacterium]|nr:hypothetical protein [Acidimicrobiaceae bacterium]
MERPPHHAHFELPRLRDLARHAVPHIVEATLVPVAIFYLCLWHWGSHVAIWAALAWSSCALVRRIVLRKPVPGLLLIGWLGLAARTAIAAASGSVFVYFLQPSLATGVVGAAFLFSIPAGRPLAQRLARDFVPFPDGYIRRPAIRRVFVQLTVIWALVNLLNATGTLLLLISEPVATYVAAKTGLTAVVTGSGILLSSWWFRRVVKRHPFVPAPAPSAPRSSRI